MDLYPLLHHTSRNTFVSIHSDVSCMAARRFEDCVMANVFSKPRINNCINHFIQLNHPSDPKGSLQDRRALWRCCSEMELYWWGAYHFVMGQEQEAEELGHMLRAAAPITQMVNWNSIRTRGVVTFGSRFIGPKIAPDLVRTMYLLQRLMTDVALAMAATVA